MKHEIKLLSIAAPADELADELVEQAGASVQAKGVYGAVGDRGVWGCWTTQFQYSSALELYDKKRVSLTYLSI